MKKNNQILYAIIGVLLGVVLVLGILFYMYAGKMRAMEQQVKSMESTMSDAVAQAKNGTSQNSDSADVESEYVPVDAEEEAQEQKEEQKKEKKKEQANKEEKETTKVTPTPTQEAEQVDASTQFDDLKPQVESLLESYKGQVGGTWAVYVEDLKTGGSMTVNDEKMQAASLIKLYIMGAVYENFDALSSSGNLGELLTKMITVSDNDASNELVKILGGGDTSKGMMAVNAFCAQHGYNNTSMGRLLLADNSVADNYTSVADCGKFLYHMYNNKFSHSSEMMELLLAQTRRSKIPAGIPDGVQVGNKTGELDDVQNDAAIVYAGEPYVVCIMSEGVSGTEGPVQAIASLSNVIYGYTNET